MKFAWVGVLCSSLYLASAPGLATGPGKPTQDHTCQGGHNCNGGGSAAQEQSQSQNQTQTAQGGAGGVASFNAGNVGGNSSSEHNSAVSVITDSKRHAPPVQVVSSPSTAEYMACFGLGGSSTSGAATGAWCWIQKDVYALHVSDLLASRGEYREAAEVFCSRKLHYRAYDDQDACEIEYTQALSQAPGMTWVVEDVEGFQQFAHAEQNDEVKLLKEQNRHLVDTLERIERRVTAREETIERQRREELRRKQEADERWYEQIQQVQEKLR